MSITVAELGSIGDEISTDLFSSKNSTSCKLNSFPVRTIIIKMKDIFIIFSICLFFLVGCAAKESAPPAPKKQLESEVLIIGLIPEENIFDQRERYKPLAEYISSKTGYTIKLVVLPEYGNIIDNFVSKNMDGAFFGSFTYALAHEKLGVEVLARPENLKGVSTYHGLIFVRKDSGIRSIKDMKGKRFVFVDKATTAGYLLPLDYFQQNNITDYKTYFGETYFTGTHDDAIYDVLDGKADIGAAKNTIYERLEEADPRVKEKLLILKESPDVPENALGLRKNIDKAVKKKLKEVLLTMDSDPAGKDVLKQFGARRFIETTDDDYQPVIKYCKHIHLDLSKYAYMNE
jgi:phosphonate transport system substrate-binding protein